MNQRADANLAAAYFVHRATKDNPAVARINGNGHSFTIDVRTRDDAKRGDYIQKMRQIVDESLSVDEVLGKGSAVAIPELPLADTLEQGATETGSMRLVSGAYHDAAAVALAGIPTGMYFIRCRGGVSHSPLEYATPRDIAAGATALAKSLVILDKL